MKATHKPVEVEVIQYTREPLNANAINEFVAGAGEIDWFGRTPMFLRWSDGNRYRFQKGDWLIKRATGCVYTCTPESFETNYSVTKE
jgi:hypothetical protein